MLQVPRTNNDSDVQVKNNPSRPRYSWDIMGCPILQSGCNSISMKEAMT